MRKKKKYFIRDELQKKLDLYDKAKSPKIGEFFTWDEFCEIFNNSEFIFEATYENLMILLINEGKRATIVCDSAYSGTVTDFKTSQELLSNGKIGDKLLSEIWDKME